MATGDPPRAGVVGTYVMNEKGELVQVMSIPMADCNKRPFCCPVCMGTGLVSRPPDVAGDVTTWTSSGMGAYPCKACKGKGVLWG